jgi:predicted DNA-binding transcriptional regulator AlpA
VATKRSLDDMLKALENSFTIDDYLELRNRFPDEDTAIWMVMGSNESSPSFGMDFTYQLEQEFKQFDLPVELFLGVLDGDKGYLDLLCLRLLEALSRREKLTKQNPHAVATNLAIGDALVDFLIGAVLESVSYYSIKVPDSFQVLLKYRLRLFENAIKEERVLKHRRVMVALMMAENPSLSARGLAKQTGLSPSTISRWMTDDDFMSYVKMFRTHPPR